VDAPIDVVGRAAAILRAVSAQPAGLTTTAIAQQVGLARPTAHRLLSSLLAEGLVDRDPAGRWHLGPELYLMGATAARRYDVTEIAHPFVTRLAAATGESAFFSARRGDETVCLLREEGSFPIRSHVLYEGIRFPLGVASAGLAILAHLDDREVADYLARADLAPAYGDEHAVVPLRDRIGETRRTGYAVNPGLIVAGSWGLGAAVFDRDQRPRWAVSLTGIEQRLGGERLGRLGELLLRSAHSITQAIAAAPR
jgi:DNA-binding IclR family transcriptional regulator